jgi:tetratricopeptide (TPR) repeat protein/serine/threonine protein kinase
MNERAIFEAALDRKDPEERSAFLNQVCGADQPLRHHIEGLLKAHEMLGSFLAAPPPAPAVTIDGPITEGPGTIIGPYKLMEQIGEGGMGLVFVAEQQHPVRRKVALKVIKPGMDTRQVIARFEAERQALALMDHPNIAKVLDGGTTGGEPGGVSPGRPYFVMELVKGVPITDYCDQNQVPIRQRLALFLNVCEAVQHAHQKGIIHRDIKPSNVLVMSHDGKPVVRVIDFGIAKAIGQQLTDKTIYTQFAQLVGTPLYMSPEQAGQSGLDVDTRSDIYSLGVLLYELLTGTTPFDKDRLKEAGYDELRRIIREEEPPRPSTRISTLGRAASTISSQRQSDPRQLSRLFRGDLDWIVMKALEKDRGRRYETVNGLARDIERYLQDEPVLACPPSVGYRLRKFMRRNKVALTTAALVLLILLTVAGSIGWILRDRAGRLRESSQQVRHSLDRARTAVSHKQLAKARQELSEAMGRIGQDRALLGTLVDDVEAVEEDVRAVEVEVDKLQRFLDLINQAHEAQFPQAGALVVQTDTAGGRPAVPQPAPHEADRAKVVTFLLRALSCYGVLEQDDWSARLAGSLLEPDQIARVRRTVYEELLWLARNVVYRRVGHRSGRMMSPGQAAQEGLAYLRRAEPAARALFVRPTSSFYEIRAHCRKTLGQEVEARKDAELAQQTPRAIALDHYMRGMAAWDAKNRAESVEHFEAALRVEPTHYWSLFWLGICLTTLGQEQDSAAAAAAFTGCILKRPDQAQAYCFRGVAYLRHLRTKEALADFREALRLRPDFADAQNNLGLALEAQGKLPEAEAAYREALRLRPDMPAAHDNLGFAVAKKGKLAEALREHREAIRLQPDSPIFHNSLGAALVKQGKHVEAVAAYRKALSLRPDFPEAHHNLGNALEKQRKLTEAEAAWREAIRLRPDWPEDHNNLGFALNHRGKHAEAEVECREALRLRPDYPEAHVTLGVALEGQGKLNAAEAEYREAMRLRPDFPEAHRNLGDLLFKKGKHAEAEAQYREALRLRPDWPDVHNNLGVVLATHGKLAEAVKKFREALRLRPDYPEAHTSLGIALFTQGKHAAGEAEFREALRLQPDFPAVLNYLALCLNEQAWHLATCADARARDPGRAVGLAREAVALQPKDGNFWCTLGLAHYRAGDWKAAVEALQKSRELRKGGDAFDWFFLAMAHWQQGAKGKARTYYDQAVQWMEKNASQNEQLRRFRTEAEELLGIKKKEP